MFKYMLKALRERQGLSQKLLADAVGVSQSTVGNWESGIREPNFDMVTKLAHFFDVSTDVLLGTVPLSAAESQPGSGPLPEEAPQSFPPTEAPRGEQPLYSRFKGDVPPGEPSCWEDEANTIRVNSTNSPSDSGPRPSAGPRAPSPADPPEASEDGSPAASGTASAPPRELSPSADLVEDAEQTEAPPPGESGEPQPPMGPTYHDEANEYLDLLHKRADIRMLFSVAKNATREDIELAVALIERLMRQSGTGGTY